MKALEKVIKEAVDSDKYKSGLKEVLQSISGTKLIIISKSIKHDDKARLDEQAKTANVAIYEYPGTSVQLGKLCNKPFRITAISIKSGTAAEIESIISNKEAAK